MGIVSSNISGAPFNGGTITGALVVNKALAPSTSDRPLDILDPNNTDSEVSVQRIVDGSGNENVVVALAAALNGTASVTLGDDNFTGSAVLGSDGRLQLTQRAGYASAGVVCQGVASPFLTSGALPTQQYVSGAGARLASPANGRDCDTHTPVTFNPGVATTATCTVEVSPNNVTYSVLAVITKPVGTVFDGEIDDVTVHLLAGWYLRLTVVNATLGLTTYY